MEQNKVFNTFVEMTLAPMSNAFYNGQKVFCSEHNRFYVWNQEKQGWDISKDNDEKRLDISKEIDDYFSKKGIVFFDGGINIQRKDGTDALSIGLKDDYSEIVFFDETGKIVGIINTKLFQ